ncbi:MAG TPA: hypothetical protein VL048_03555 [Xanthobacteraceae bacterium]|nr:hypothetical protein [Xanthobacteraceae bacterium]
MSIYVFVTRRADPLKPDGAEISREEWTELVESDPDLSLEDPADRIPADKTIYAVWKTYPGGYPAWLGLSGGNIEVKGIDDAILGKLRMFANKLGARIVSEEGEEFS